MFTSNRTIARLGLASLLGAVAGFAAPSAEAAAPACDAAALNCAVGSGAMKGQIKTKLPTEIDSGWMEKGVIKVRTRFTIDPVGSDPLVDVDMSQGAQLQASWGAEKGVLEVRPTIAEGATGTMKVHYQLVPSLEASIYGVQIAYNASQLINLLPGGAFNYDSKAEGPIPVWGFTPGTLLMPAPALDQSTIFALPFSTLGIDSDIVEGQLAIQASTKPTFKFASKTVKIDGTPLEGGLEGVVKVNVGDVDGIDITAAVTGEISTTGALQVRPNVRIDSVAGIPTFGAVKFSFSAVSKDYATAPVPMNLTPAVVHIPLPNVKLGQSAVNMGNVQAGGSADKTVQIGNTGEMDALVSFESDNPQFTVPSGSVRVGTKTKYDLKIGFKPSAGGAATANIKVKSNDPDSPEQILKIGANGAVVEGADGESSDGPAAREALDAPGSDSEGCTVAAVGSGTSRSHGFGALGLGLGLFVLARRRRH